MQIIALYVAVVLIWGSTWIAISFQLGVVAVEVSVGYRFGIAAIVLYAYALISRRQILLPLSALPMILLQGLLLFCLNYFFVYYGTAYLTTGLIAVLFSSIILANALFERLLFRTPLDKRLTLASALGITGIAMVFWPEVTALTLEDDVVFGIVLILIAVVIASLGNMAAVVNTRRTLPVVAVNAHAMACATLLSLAVAALMGREFNFSTQTSYVVSLAYLAVLGSAVAFGLYLALIRLIGSTRAAYCSVLFPIVALGISTFAEDYQWTLTAGIGILLAFAGNWLILSRPKLPVQKTIDTTTRQTEEPGS